MEVNLLNGVGSNQGIGLDMNTKNKAQHVRNRVLLSAGREALKKVAQWNWFGVGTALFYGWHKNKNLLEKWKVAWYNAGGLDFWTLYKKAEQGANQKAKMMKIAPKKIKEAYTKATGKKISGCTNMGYASPIGATTAAILSALGSILLILGGLVGQTYDASASDLDRVGMEEDDPETQNGGDGGNDKDKDDDKSVTPLLLMGGLGLLAVFSFGKE